MEQIISAQTLAARLGEPGLVILDCSVGVARVESGSPYVSGKPLFEDAHIPGAQHADLVATLSDAGSKMIFALPNPQTFRDEMQALGVRDGATVVLYDRSFTAWAARVWWMLRWIGFDAAYVLDGGMPAWRAADLPLAQDVTPPEVGPLSLHLRAEVVASQDDVRRGVEAPQVCLIDTLQAEDFAGETNAYGRPGHIAGATHMPALAMFDDAGCFKPAFALREMYDADTTARQVTYCGAGILAAVTAFVLVQLGYEDVALYAASLQEWAADPDNPMEVGSD